MNSSVLFWVAGTYRYYQPLNAGQQVSIHTWLERITRIRVYIRQEIRTADGAELLGASREEHLVVSLSQARAKPLPPELAALIQDCVEYRD
jgi:acyl-CoA thioesterase FadM